MLNEYDSLVERKKELQTKSLLKENIPTPLIKALTHQIKEYITRKDSATVTQLLRESQITYLLYRNQFKLSPNLFGDLIYSIFGMGVHSLVEIMQDSDTNIYEKRGSISFNLEGGYGKFTVRFKPDEIKNGILTDYKTTSVYKLDKIIRNGILKEAFDYAKQIGYYKILNQYYYNIKIKKARLFIIARDYTFKHKLKNIPSYASIDMPDIFTDGVLKKMLLEDIKRYINAIRGKYAECLSTWGGNKCKYYCEVSEYCNQYNPKIKGLDDE